MNHGLARCRTMLDVLVAPDAAFHALDARPAFGAAVLCFGALSAVTLLAQSALLEPALRQDPLRADLPAGAAIAPAPWFALRLIVATVAGLGVVMRGVAFGSLLHALALACGGRGSWRHSVALVVHLEIVFLLEAGCLLVLLVLERPETWEEARALQLRAGLDLWLSSSDPSLRAALAAVNAFTLWWGVLLVRGVARLMQISWPRAAALALPLWSVAVLLRFFLQPR